MVQVVQLYFYMQVEYIIIFDFGLSEIISKKMIYIILSAMELVLNKQFTPLRPEMFWQVRRLRPFSAP